MKIFTDEFKEAFVEVSAKVLGTIIVFGPLLFLTWLAFAFDAGLFGF